MTYEVYIDVRHHPRHLEDFEQRLSSAFKRSGPADSDPPEADRIREVVACLRDMADRLDPDAVCGHCELPRSDHHNWTVLPQCFNRYGPITQWPWWRWISHVPPKTNREDHHGHSSHAGREEASPHEEPEL